MQSSSSPKLTREKQQGLLTPHEYIRDSFSFRYQDCISCGKRTGFACIKCGYCFSCHWKREQVEETELRDNLKDFYLSLSKASNDDDNNNQKLKLKQDKAEDPDQGLGKWGTLDVLGQPAEPICAYYRCHHKFSLHGSRRCRCKHPTNRTLGIEVRYL
jgi:hypothetical protein